MEEESMVEFQFPGHDEVTKKGRNRYPKYEEKRIPLLYVYR
jgi:hypothetical protein